MPIRMMGLPGNLPVRWTWPLIVPVLWANPSIDSSADSKAARNRSTTRFFIKHGLVAALLLAPYRFGSLFVRIPVLEMALFAGVVDAVAGVQQALSVFRFDSLERFQRRVMQTVGVLDPAGAILVDGLLDLIGTQLDFWILGLFTRLGNMAARNLQQIGSLQEHDRVIPDLLPILICMGSFLFSSFGAHDGFDGVPDVIGSGIDESIHDVLHGCGRPIFRLRRRRLGLRL